MNDRLPDGSLPMRGYEGYRSPEDGMFSPAADMLPDSGFWSVAPFHVSREYGGPQEGGWWYDAGEPLAGPEFPLPVIAVTIQAAREAQETMQATLDEMNREDGNRPRGSVLSSGEYEARITDGYPMPFPDDRPRYE